MAACKAETPRKKTVTVELSSAAQLPESTNCLACSDDGRYLSLGHSRGLSVWCASSLVCVAEWLQDRLEVASIQMTNMAETTYLLGCIDDMGVARVFAYLSEDILLLSVINTMDDITRKSICLTFELSKGGDYGVASIKCNSAVWLEVYHFPSEEWWKELQAAVSQKQDPNLSGNVKWSPVAAIKIRPPKIPPVAGAEGSLEASDILTNCLSLDETTDALRRCTQHFLLPCGQFPADSKAKSEELPVAVCLWWSGGHNLLQFVLQKAQKNKQDVEATPDVLWPNAKEILCSAVSRCSRFIALGLRDALVCVWDRLSGSQLSVSVVSTESHFLSMQFIDYWPVTSDDSHSLTAGEIHLMMVCKSGAIHTVTTGRGTKPCAVQLTERPKDSGDLPTITASVPFLQGLSLVVQRNGNIFLQDVINKTTVCVLIPPTTHLLATPCNPVYALNVRQHILFIRGDQDASCSGSSTADSQSQLFIFSFREPDSMKQYIVSLPDFPRQPKTLRFVDPEEACNLYLQERALTVDARCKAIQQTWKQLQETTVKDQ